MSTTLCRRSNFDLTTKNGALEFVQQITQKAKELKDKYTDQIDAPADYACIFCQSQSEFEQLVKIFSEFGQEVEDHGTGPLFHIPPLNTVAGDIKLVRIRKFDSARTEWGNADFLVSSYPTFKKRYLDKSNFNLIARPDFEMIELLERDNVVRAYFAHPPVSEVLEIK